MDRSGDLPQIAMRKPPNSGLARNAATAQNTDRILVPSLAASLQRNIKDVDCAYSSTSRNVRTVLQRQFINAANPTPDQPVCKFRGEQHLYKSLSTLPAEVALLTIARIYDEAHITLCKTISAARKNKPHHEDFRRKPVVDLQLLADGIDMRKEAVEDRIVLEWTSDKNVPRRAVWKHVSPMSFHNLPRLSSLSGMLPGERVPSRGYAGIGGGGGSDVISASLLGLLLRRHNKQMDLLVSTRTWATGSQGSKGSKIGVKREVYNHGGQAKAGGVPVSGTFRIKEDTYAEGRDLETIPLSQDQQVYMVLDQGESALDIPENDRADLKDQFDAVLAEADADTLMIINTGGDMLRQHKHYIDTVLSVDTGGDVFGADKNGGSTPDQDFRVQKAISTLKSNHNLVTAVVAPGVDAPHDAPEKALSAGGMVYKPTKDEEKMLLKALIDYRMDGSDPSRFGKTTLALQARLRGVLGWTSLDLPEHVINTWENPWSSFVYIQECMSDIILMPTKKLLPLIAPANQGFEPESHG